MSDPYAFGGLGQLTSPPLSALEMAAVFTETDPDAWRAPLGSVDVLISPHPSYPRPGGRIERFTDPTAANLKRAYNAWWRRCNQDSDSVAILYLCGHGIQGDEQYFLASDFGASERTPWDNAIAVDATVKGLWHNKAKTQCVFVDACREVVPASGSIAGIYGTPLDQFVPGRATHHKYPLLLRAVAPTERAFAQEGSPAYFTKALALALRGAAAEEDDATGEWSVTTAGIAAKIHEIMQEIAPDRDHTAEPIQGNSTSLHLLRTPPTVLLRVDCDPSDANVYAALACDSSSDGSLRFARSAGQATTWELPVPAGYYKVSAAFSRNARFRNATRNVLAAPPNRNPKLKVFR